MIVAEDALTPVTVPPVFTEAIAELLVLHVPPEGVQPSDIVLPVHTVEGPVMEPGWGLTVITVVMVQPVVAV